VILSYNAIHDMFHISHQQSPAINSCNFNIIHYHCFGLSILPATSTVALQCLLLYLRWLSGMVYGPQYILRQQCDKLTLNLSWSNYTINNTKEPTD